MRYANTTLLALVLCFSALIGLPVWAEGRVDFVVLVALGGFAGGIVVCAAWLGAMRPTRTSGRAARD